MKNAVKLITVALLLSLIFAACGQPAEEEIFDEEFIKTSEKLDLEGVKIIYQMGLSDSVSALPVCLGYELDTQLGDAAQKRLRDTQTDLNCNIDLRYVYGGENTSGYYAASASGLYICDVISGTTDIWADVARIGMAIGLTELEDYIDFRNEAKWGYRNMLEVVYYENDLYGIVPLLWPEISVDYRTPLVVNENIIAALGETDPRDYVENGLWTWDLFDDCLGRYYREEGGEVIHYALTSSTESFGSMFILSNGSKDVEKDLSGKYISGFYDEKTLKAMQRAVDIYYGPNTNAINKTGSEADTFVSGKTAMATIRTTSIIGVGARVAREMDNFGILSWPVGPDVDPHYIFSHYSNNGYCITFSRMSPNPEAAAMIIDALYEPFDEYKDMNALIDLLTKNYFYDRRDSELYYEMYLNSVYNYFHYTGMFGLMSSWLSPSYSITEYLEANKDMVAKNIEKYAAPTMRGIEAVWGDQNQ